MSDEKWCPCCKTMLNKNDFYLNMKGYSSYCRPCHIKEIMDRYRKTNVRSNRIRQYTGLDAKTLFCIECENTISADNFSVYKNKGTLRKRTRCKPCEKIFQKRMRANRIERKKEIASTGTEAFDIFQSIIRARLA